jgi:uncharacterized protein (DUF2267 family)
VTATGLEVFDKTIQTTHMWLNDIMDPLDVDRHVAWRVLAAVLQTLRERLPVELAAHLGSQLPLIVRGAYYDQFAPARQPSDCDTPEAFMNAVAERLSDLSPVDPDDAVATVFAVLDRNLSEGQMTKVRHALPRGVRMAWDGAEARQLTEAGA